MRALALMVASAMVIAPAAATADGDAADRIETRVSGYVAGLGFDGSDRRDGLETQTRVDVAVARRWAAHAAYTFDAVRVADAVHRLHDVDLGVAGAFAPRARWWWFVEAHGLVGDALADRGAAAFAGVRLRATAVDVELGAGGLALADHRSGTAAARVEARPGPRWLALAAQLIVTRDDAGTRAAAGGAEVRIGPLGRVTLTLAGLAGPRAAALLSSGQVVEATRGVQRESARGLVTLELGHRCDAYVGVLARAATAAPGRSDTMMAVLAGADWAF